MAIAFLGVFLLIAAAAAVAGSNVNSTLRHHLDDFESPTRERALGNFPF
jgi:hypothetical protein